MYLQFDYNFISDIQKKMKRWMIPLIFQNQLNEQQNKK